jgi:hypothetical protein
VPDTVPTTWAGVIQVRVVGFVTVIDEQGASSRLNPVAPIKFVPVTITGTPPETEP